ncbi:hypothetical protein [Pseudoclavibacter terrae]|uniref:hypothetical protein n=1 Tax=Pseudoclavibacter terrae TaxID=1530195 RepID=UPI00232EB200|nr:hypothetical protein [Pseudoclavibacter terrae]
MPDFTAPDALDPDRPRLNSTPGSAPVDLPLYPRTNNNTSVYRVTRDRLIRQADALRDTLDEVTAVLGSALADQDERDAINARVRDIAMTTKHTA